MSNLNIGSSEKRRKTKESDSFSEGEYRTPEKNPTKREGKNQEERQPKTENRNPTEYMWRETYPQEEPPSPEYEEITKEDVMETESEEAKG